MAEAVSNRAADMSVFLRNLTVTHPRPRYESELVPVQPLRDDSTPSTLLVTSASTTLAGTSGHDHETVIDSSLTDGAYCTLRAGMQAMPATASAVMSSRTVKAGRRFMAYLRSLRR